jgi:hypothetical protein
LCVPLAVQVIGQASKRGIIPRVPSAERLLADIEQWVVAEYPEIVRSSGSRTTAAGETELWVDLHPAAPAAIFSATEGRVGLSAVTAGAGPGYHRFVDRLANRLATDLSIDWAAGAATDAGDGTTGGALAPLRLTGGSSPQASQGTIDERQAVERSYLGWLGRALAAARDRRQRDGHGAYLETPPGALYTFDGAIATILGPRDDAWLDRAIADPQAGIDVAPWWADATDARYLLGRALCLMWTEVRWRPAVDAAEQKLLDEVARLLWQAFPFDPSLAYPWREWHELLQIRGVEDPAADRLVEQRSAAAPDDTPLIGYRRAPVTVVHEGWTLEVPGSFAERRTPEEWWGGDGSRSITLAGVETGTDSGPMSPEAFLHQVASDLGSDGLTHEAGGVIGRARLGSDVSSGVEVGVVEGYSATWGRGAAVRVVFGDPADWQWALDAWRALTPA